jgi:hypothetical protein
VIVRFNIALSAVLGVVLCSCGQPAKQSEPTQQQASGTQAPEANLPKIPPPKFSVFKFKTDMPTSYVVPMDTTDEQLRSLLWLFRGKVRAGQSRDIGITYSRSKQSGRFGNQSGMLLVYRGDECANEEYVSDAQLEKGNLGPCGYGEHDDAYYQWGVDGDPNKDDAGIRTKNGDNLQVFDYKDNWHASSEALQRVDPKVKEEWNQEYVPRQQFATAMTNTLNGQGMDINASANAINPTQLDFRSQLFKNPAVRESFVNKSLPQIRRNLCNAGFRSIRILQEGDFDAGQNYPLKCQ